jgi:hypothetical protein
MKAKQIQIDEPTSRVLAALCEHHPGQGWRVVSPDRFEGRSGALELVLERCEAQGRWRLTRGQLVVQGVDALALLNK